MNEDRCAYRRRVFSARKTFEARQQSLRSANRPQLHQPSCFNLSLASSFLDSFLITVASRQICIQDVPILWGKQGWSRTSTDLDLSRLLTTFLFSGAYLQGHRYLPCRDPLVSYIQTSRYSSNNQQDWRGITAQRLPASHCLPWYVLSTDVYVDIYWRNSTRLHLQWTETDSLQVRMTIYPFIPSLSIDIHPANSTIGCSRRLLRLV